MKMKKPKFKQTETGMLPEDWEVNTIGNVCKSISQTYNFKDEYQIIFLNTGDISNGQVLKKSYMDIKNLPGQAKKRIKINDILFSEIRPINKRYAFIDFDANEFVVSTKLMVIRCNNIIYPKFLYYLLTEIKMLRYFQMLAESRSGTFPQITFDIIKTIQIPIPNLNEQRTIVRFIENIDNKLILIQKQNHTLESIGQVLFKHWFVEFEFPNEKGKPYKSSGGEMVDSELGMIPKGWKVSKIGKEFETILGGTPSTTNKSYWENGTVAWINSGEINKFRITEPTAYITKEAVDNSATKLMPKGTTVLAITGATLGQVSRIEIDTCANQSVIGIIENKDISSEYIYLLIKHRIIGLISHQTGGAQQHINKKNVNELDILLPDDSRMLKFKKMMSSIFKNISINCFESQNLSQIRDSLLPRLMSGKIRVPVEVRA